MPSRLHYIESKGPLLADLVCNQIMPFADREEQSLEPTKQAEAGQPLHRWPEALLADQSATINRLSHSRSSRSPSRSLRDHDPRLPRRHSRRSVIVNAPEVPRIPAHFLATGQPAPVASPNTQDEASPALHRSAFTTSSTHERTIPLKGESSSDTGNRDSLRHSNSLNFCPKDDLLTPVPRTPKCRRTGALHRGRSLPDTTRNSTLRDIPVNKDAHRARTLSRLENCVFAQEAGVHMARSSKRDKNEDYFLEVAEDGMAESDEFKQLRRSEHRTSKVDKRLSLPADALASLSDRRPNSRGNIYTAHPTSRFTVTKGLTDAQRHVEHHRSTPHRASIHFGDSASISGLSTSGRARRFSTIPDHSPASPSRFRERLASPELPQYRLRRPSVGSTASSTRQREFAHTTSRTIDSQDQSPTEGSEPKQTDSTSNESQTADTVWDELDDLKSRIKKLELTGKMPLTSSAAVSGESSDRPHTATTAPTTVDSSPKQDRKRFTQEQPGVTPQSQLQFQLQSGSTDMSISNVHPTLHAALAKAEPLLNVNIFRILETTAMDALQLATMTRSTGPQGNTFSPSSIANGAIASDRNLRRKADMMCRNLTDLCLALCEGKFERPNVASRHEISASPSLLTSPQSEDTLTQESPSLRRAESDIGHRAISGRPISRLEARRSSILGLHTAQSFESISAQSSFAESPTTKGQLTPAQRYPMPQQRVSRAPSALRSRAQRSDVVTGDDDTTIRPPSRAMTDIGAPRVRPRNATEDRSTVSQRSPSLRELLAARRSNEAAFDGNQEVIRMTSESRRRKIFDQQNTPPVLEEENSPTDFHTSGQSRRGILASEYSNSSRRTTAEFGRSSSMRHQRHVFVE